jgi:hypothetical protein
MMRCRMCSQRLPRPGRLCRECDRELERARYAGVSIGELAPSPSSVEASRMAPSGSRARSPGPVIAAAFSVGLVAAVALHVVDKSEAAVTRASVMPEGNAPRALRRVSIGDASALAVTAVVEAPASRPGTAPVTPRMARPPVREPATRDPVVESHGESDAPAQVAVVAPAQHATQRAGVPDGTLEDALSHCSGERFLARPACEERARARYCDGAAASAQCALPEREHGQ